MTTILEAIEFYKREGIRYFPLQPREKRPVNKWKEYKEKGMTAEEIQHYFVVNSYNLGVICAQASNGFFCLDFDDPDLYNSFFPEDKREGLVIIKSNRGYHVYFRADTEIKTLKCFNASGAEALTLKGENTYMVAGGSTHPNGTIYEFVSQGEIPTLTGNVREHIKKRASEIGLNFGNAEESSETIDIENILRGSVRGAQDNSIMWVSHYLRRQGASFEEAFSIMQKWNMHNLPVIPESELYEKLKNHYKLPEPFSFYFKTNPTKISIMPDLSLQRTEYLISINVQDLMDEDANGKQAINRDRVCDYIESEYKFKGVADTGELYFYENGIYVSRPGGLDRILQRLFGADATIRFKSEMRKQILDRNPIERSEMNNDSDFIPVENGLLNLSTHQIESFTPDKFFTSGIPIFFDRNASAPSFLGFIREIVGAEDIAVIQEWFGYSLLKNYPNAKALFLIGEGGNGKSVLTQILTAFLDRENVSFLPLSEMDGHHRFSTFSLFGKLLNIASEPPTDKMLETSLFKLITGNSPIEAELKGVQTRVKFTSYAKIVVEANTVPQIADSKQALWDRIIPVEFPNSFRGRPTEKINLAEELSAAPVLSGILNWALEGLERLRKNNFQFTLSRRQELKKIEMQILTNPFLAFQNHWLQFSRNFETTKQTIYDAYELYCVVNSIPSLNKGVISKNMLNDNRIAAHRIQENGLRLRIFRGCALSETVIAAYGWYRDRPLRPGELENVENPEEEIEVRTCELSDYFVQYLEPIEEVQAVIGEKLIIFNSADLVELYKLQASEGEIKHQGPQTKNREHFEEPKPKTKTLKIESITPSEMGLCERCNKEAQLTYKMVDEDGEHLICHLCSYELKQELDLQQPKVFNTTLEERRKQIKESEKGGI